MHPEIENLINMALANDEVTEKERAIILRKAEALGVDKDEVEMILDGKIALMKKEQVFNYSVPKSNKEGDLKKCPSCGATTQSFTTNCSECGHEFRSNEKSIQDLLNELENHPLPVAKGIFDFSYASKAYAAGRKRAEIINTFPVPNYKEHILEFLGMVLQNTKVSFSLQGILGILAANADMGKSQEISAWKQKGQQIIMKARVSLKDDKKTFEQVEHYAKQLGIK